MTRGNPNKKLTSEVLNRVYDEDLKWLYVNDPILAISMGDIPGISCINKFGENPSSAQDTQEDLWDGGGTYSYPATALMTNLSQTTNQAVLVGGDIEIQGLDANWAAVTQTIALDAADTTTAVLLTTPLLRAFRMRVLEDVVATSPIRVHNAAETVDYAIISTGLNQTAMALYSVPAGVTAYMTNYFVSVTRSAALDPTGTDVKLWGADRANGYAFQMKHSIGLPNASTPYRHEFNTYKIFTEKTDIKLSSLCAAKAGQVHGGFDLILVTN